MYLKHFVHKSPDWWKCFSSTFISQHRPIKPITAFQMNLHSNAINLSEFLKLISRFIIREIQKVNFKYFLLLPHLNNSKTKQNWTPPTETPQHSFAYVCRPQSRNSPAKCIYLNVVIRVCVFVSAKSKGSSVYFCTDWSPAELQVPAVFGTIFTYKYIFISLWLTCVCVCVRVLYICLFTSSNNNLVQLTESIDAILGNFSARNKEEICQTICKTNTKM